MHHQPLMTIQSHSEGKTMRCAVDYDLERYLDQLDYEERLSLEMNTRIIKLMAPGAECDPLSDEHVCEALGQLPDLLMVQIGEAIKAKDAEKVLKLINDGIHAYWSDIAEYLAEKELKKDMDDYE